MFAEKSLQYVYIFSIDLIHGSTSQSTEKVIGTFQQPMAAIIREGTTVSRMKASFSTVSLMKAAFSTVSLMKTAVGYRNI